MFFDDHQNSVQRLRECLWWGFKHIAFDDNYSPPHGDCYSLRRVLMGAGFRFDAPIWPPSGYKARRFLERFLSEPLHRIDPNDHDRHAALRHIKTYYEFPPTFQREKTRWGDDWGSHNTKPPIFDTDQATEYPTLFRDDAYSWFAYVELK